MKIETPKTVEVRCFRCGEIVTPRERSVTNGWHTLCEDCARGQSNRIYDKMLRAFEEEHELHRLAFLGFGWEDFAGTIDEEKDNG